MTPAKNPCDLGQRTYFTPLDELGNEVLLFADCDKAVLGISYLWQADKEPVAVYSYEKLVDVFVDQGMTPEVAVDWIDFNVEGAYFGDKTPIIVHE